VVTGASGAGKTTLVRALEAAGLPGVGCFYFDSIGVPSREEMVSRWSGPGGWQAFATEHWLRRIAHGDDGIRVAVLDGQTAPSGVLAVAEHLGLAAPSILHVDCAHAERNARLHARGQPELASAEMDCWAAYLRGQADALGLPIMDTTGRAVAESVADLITRVRQLAPAT
jgi:hypothetical protein